MWRQRRTLTAAVFQVLNKENASWPHSFVQSYVTHKTGEEHTHEHKNPGARTHADVHKPV